MKKSLDNSGRDFEPFFRIFEPYFFQFEPFFQKIRRIRSYKRKDNQGIRKNKVMKGGGPVFFENVAFFQKCLDFFGKGTESFRPFFGRTKGAAAWHQFQWNQSS